MASPEILDPYLIPETSVLRNLVCATSTTELVVAEADLSFARALQLLDFPVAATNGLEELKGIHLHLFQDVYDWAGQLRSVDVRKEAPGAEFFMPWSYIESAAAIYFGDLVAERFLVGLSREAFVERLAFHYEKVTGARHLSTRELSD